MTGHVRVDGISFCPPQTQLKSCLKAFAGRARNCHNECFCASSGMWMLPFPPAAYIPGEDRGCQAVG